VTAAATLLYHRRIRLPRPAIGVFNGRDVVVLLVFITLLPLLYLAVPSLVLTGFLCLTFGSALSIGYQPVLGSRTSWLIIAGLLGADTAIATTSLHSEGGWQAYWAVNSLIVVLAAAAIANLYIQGGMRLRHVTWFAVGLAVYDPIFSMVIPITDKLAARFVAHPLDASIGYRLNGLSVNLGIGDLLVFSLFALAATREHGRRGAAAALTAIASFAALTPVLLPAFLHFGGTDGGFVIPAQAFFGPAAALTYLWLTRTTVTPQAEPNAGQARQLPRPRGQAAPVLSGENIDPEAGRGRTPASTGSRRALGGTRP
jgi:hypothetical protein